mmetsp:Transcript_7847/g.31000  ORF Transcript_7847/g.31000 Transcript_7847/m.31000 type:complete len:292 (-) Transcript_7847:374-1249(-)
MPAAHWAPTSSMSAGLSRRAASAAASAALKAPQGPRMKQLLQRPSSASAGGSGGSRPSHPVSLSCCPSSPSLPGAGAAPADAPAAGPGWTGRAFHRAAASAFRAHTRPRVSGHPRGMACSEHRGGSPLAAGRKYSTAATGSAGGCRAAAPRGGVPGAPRLSIRLYMAACALCAGRTTSLAGAPPVFSSSGASCNCPACESRRPGPSTADGSMATTASMTPASPHCGLQTACSVPKTALTAVAGASPSALALSVASKSPAATPPPPPPPLRRGAVLLAASTNCIVDLGPGEA